MKPRDCKSRRAFRPQVLYHHRLELAIKLAQCHPVGHANSLVPVDQDAMIAGRRGCQAVIADGDEPVGERIPEDPEQPRHLLTPDRQATASSDLREPAAAALELFSEPRNGGMVRRQRRRIETVRKEANAQQIIAEFIARDNHECLIERLGHGTPAQARAEAMRRVACFYRKTGGRRGLKTRVLGRGHG